MHDAGTIFLVIAIILIVGTFFAKDDGKPLDKRGNGGSKDDGPRHW